MGEYEIEAWWSGIGLGSYYSKLQVSAFIDIGTGLTSLDLLDHYKDKNKFYFAKSK